MLTSSSLALATLPAATAADAPQMPVPKASAKRNPFETPIARPMRSTARIPTTTINASSAKITKPLEARLAKFSRTPSSTMPSRSTVLAL